MKKILGILGSPRKLGNCEIMVKEISRQISEPHELLLIRLQDLNILPCKGCYHCLYNDYKCTLDDDFYRALETLIKADALIVAAPTYFLSANSSLKMFLERSMISYTHIEKMWGKPAIGIGIAGLEGKEGFTLLGIESFIKHLLLDHKKSVIINGALPGQIFLHKINKKIAKELAKALFNPPETKKTPNCTLCKGETFRFIGENKIMCMLCSNSGTLEFKNNQYFVKMDKKRPAIFLDKEDAIQHRDWLIGMKDSFIKHKKVLKKTTIEYLKDGTWIK